MSRSVKLFNLCKSYRYQSSGYYVSLLAEARGHKPLPTVGAIEDLHSQTLVRHLTEDLGSLIQRLLAPLPGNDFELGIYFGRDTGNRYQSLSRQLFGCSKRRCCPLGLNVDMTSGVCAVCGR